MTTRTVNYDNPITEDEILLKAIIKNVLKLGETIEIVNTTSIVDLGLDSISVIDMILAIEDEFKISIDLAEIDMEVFNSFANLYELINNNKKS